MEENKEILLPSKRFKKAEEEDLSLKLNLDTTQSLLRIGERDIVLDIAKLYNDERNRSVNYKIYGKMKMIFRNMYSGATSYPPLEERLYLSGDGSDENYTGFLPYDEFAFLRRDLYREVNNPSTGTTGNTLGTYTPTITTTGSQSHRTITPITAPYHNWNLYLSYVFSGDTTYPMTYSLSGSTSSECNNGFNYCFTAADGIPFRVTDNGKSYKLISPVPHGMSEGEYIVLSGGTVYISSVGDETYDSENYVINLYKSEFEVGDTLSGVVLGKRCLDINNISDTVSTYYVHKHKTLTDVNDYILDNVGFESPIFEDEKKILFENSAGVNDVVVERNRMESVLFDFKEPLILSGLTNNLGYTPTEVFLTTIFRNGNGFFNYPPKNGYKFNFHNEWMDAHFDGNSNLETNITKDTFTISGITFNSGNVIPIGTILTGAFVEYNKKELKERIISESFHKISNPTTIFDFGQTDNTVYSGSTETNPVGLYYQTHQRIKLRELSQYIETSKTNDVYNLPENTKYDANEKVWRWRDLYDHGYIDTDGYGTDFPYVNNIHYVKTNLNFYLRNERYYTNKQNGINSFKNKMNIDNKLDC